MEEGIVCKKQKLAGMIAYIFVIATLESEFTQLGRFSALQNYRGCKCADIRHVDI